MCDLNSANGARTARGELPERSWPATATAPAASSAASTGHTIRGTQEAPPPHGRALREGREHEAASALAGLDLTGCLEALSRGGQQLFARVHVPTAPASSSSARRRRELTVPRGRSSIVGDLARSVLEQVAQDDDGPLIGCQPPDRLGQVVGEIAARLGGDGLARRPRPGRRNACARAQSSARLVTMRCSQGANGRARSKRSSTRMACRNASWAMSSAACASRVTRYAAR